MQRTSDRQRTLAAHGSLISDERLPIEVLDLRQVTSVEGRVLVHGQDEQTGRNYLMLEGTDAKIHFIQYTPEMEDARSRGELRTNSFVRLQKLSDTTILDVNDLGDAEELLKHSRHLSETARKLFANDLALLCRDSDQYPEGRKLAEQAVAIRTKLLGRGDPSVAESLNTLGGILVFLGEYDQGIARMEEALAIHESQSPLEFNEEFGTLCINLAGTYQRVGRYANAEAMFEKGLNILRVKPGVNHPAYSASLVGYAYLQTDLGHYSAAEKLYDEAGKLLREQLGDQHPAYAAFLNNRAALYAQIGNVTMAEADYRNV